MSLDVVVTNLDEDHSRNPLARSSSSASSTPARHHHHQPHLRQNVQPQQHHHHHQQHLRQNHQPHQHRHQTGNSDTRSESGSYQYVPYKSSLANSTSSAQGRYASQTSLPSSRSQYAGIATPEQRSHRGQHGMPMGGSSSQQQQQLQRVQEVRQGERYVPAPGHHQPPQGHAQGQGYQLTDRQARSSSLKSSARHAVDRYAEFSDAHYQFNNQAPPPYHQLSSSSSDSSPQSSPAHRKISSRSARVAAQAAARNQHHHHPAARQSHAARTLQEVDNIPHDLNELPRASSRHRHSSVSESPYRSSSRNTFVQTKVGGGGGAHREDSFSLTSSIKCCVGFQPKKKRSARRVAAYNSQLQRARERERERQLHHSRRNGSCATANGGPVTGDVGNGVSNGGNNWVSLSAVRSQYPPHMLGNSPNHSTVSCPYTVSAGKAVAKRSSGYSSEFEGSQTTLMTGESHSQAGYNSFCESDSDFSDSEFARAAGSRGKSANSVMMKLAKKFSKKNLPITRDEGDGGSIGSDSQDKSWRLKQRSNSVSNLDSIEG